MALLLLSFGLMASMSSSVRVRQSKLVDNADASHLTALPREATCMFGKLGPAKRGGKLGPAKLGIENMIYFPEFLGLDVEEDCNADWLNTEAMTVGKKYAYRKYKWAAEDDAEDKMKIECQVYQCITERYESISFPRCYGSVDIVHVLDKVDGDNLMGKHLHQGPSVLLRMISELVVAAYQAFDCGVTHADPHAANFMVTGEGADSHIVVIDLGSSAAKRTVSKFQGMILSAWLAGLLFINFGPGTHLSWIAEFSGDGFGRSNAMQKLVRTLMSDGIDEEKLDLIQQKEGFLSAARQMVFIYEHRLADVKTLYESFQASSGELEPVHRVEGLCQGHGIELSSYTLINGIFSLWSKDSELIDACVPKTASSRASSRQVVVECMIADSETPKSLELLMRTELEATTLRNGLASHIAWLAH
eukprot:CAMPEP_0169336516 /NCGR_PEP_ID=MMETSP1017-20121227/16921_1 /TAXON_ID=342587 /ORGANISM="Karlodinium micrum, Strain CCMP2283" /LENGTH=417 /DNA_ID=CAMNT_0009431983 /DNA_START=34 /DNA_END=1284 /DNA_ORIENTATION=-